MRFLKEVSRFLHYPFLLRDHQWQDRLRSYIYSCTRQEKTLESLTRFCRSSTGILIIFPFRLEILVTEIDTIGDVRDDFNEKKSSTGFAAKYVEKTPFYSDATVIYRQSWSSSWTYKLLFGGIRRVQLEKEQIQARAGMPIRFPSWRLRSAVQIASF